MLRKLGHAVKLLPRVQMASPAPAAGSGLRHSVEYHTHDFDFEEVVPQGKAALTTFEDMRQTDEAVGKVAKRSYKSWQQFHFQHDGKFFHPRLYATEAFPELLGGNSAAPAKSLDHSLRPLPVSTECPLLHVFEVGCGNGSNVFPILERNPQCFVYATDFSPAALKTIVQNPKYCEVKDRCSVFLWDVLTHSAGTPASKPAESGDCSPRLHEYDWGTVPTIPPVDIAVCMFVLSALHPSEQLTALRNIAALLRPGGIVAFRDYGLFDTAMLRATKDNVLLPQLHVRGDGTLAYYFSLEELRKLAGDAGLIVEELEYCTVRNVNRKKQLEMKRVWVHGKFRKLE